MKPVTGWFNVPPHGAPTLLCTSAPAPLRPAAQGLLLAVLEQLAAPLPAGTVRLEVHGLPGQPSVEVVALAGPDRHVVLMECAHQGAGVAVVAMSVSAAHGKPVPTPSRLAHLQQDTAAAAGPRVPPGDSITLELVLPV